mgnify:CR=1 FL=1|jgi:hypothetical protein
MSCFLSIKPYEINPILINIFISKIDLKSILQIKQLIKKGINILILDL